MIATKNLKVKIPFALSKIVEISSVTLDKKLSVENFKALANSFPNLRMEREKDGKTTIMSPVKFGSGKREGRINGYLAIWWVENDEIGEIFSSSTAIEFKDTSVKCPDAGWISEERLTQNLAEDEDGEFLKIAPDFIVEIKPHTDSLRKLKKKMSDTWIKNGVRLAWLIDPYKQKAYIYREGQNKPEEIKGFEGKFLDGEEVLKGFQLALDKVKIFNKKRGF